MSPRRVGLLIRALPEQSNTRKALAQVVENERNRSLLAKYRQQQARKQRRLRVVS